MLTTLPFSSGGWPFTTQTKVGCLTGCTGALLTFKTSSLPGHHPWRVSGLGLGGMGEEVGLWQGGLGGDPLVGGVVGEGGGRRATSSIFLYNSFIVYVKAYGQIVGQH